MMMFISQSPFSSISFVLMFICSQLAVDIPLTSITLYIQPIQKDVFFIE